MVAAISGGPDSMFLLKALIDVRKKLDYELIVAHINHNVRKESVLEEKKVRDYCGNNNIIFEYLKIDAYGKDNFHNYSRKIRYAFLESVIKKYQAQYLMTAHHGDDLVETIMMRLVRGSTIKGYGGFIKETNCGDYCLIRPLIDMTKQEINDYMDENNLWYATD